MRRSASYSYRGRGTLETPGPSGEQETPLTLSSDGTAAPGDQEIENEAVSDDDGGGGKHGERMSTPILKAFEMVVNKGEKERRKSLYYDCHLCDKVSVCN